MQTLPSGVEGFIEEKSSSLSLKIAIFRGFLDVTSSSSLLLKLAALGVFLAFDEPENQSKDYRLESRQMVQKHQRDSESRLRKNVREMAMITANF